METKRTMRRVRSRAVLLDADDVDTDQIIAARFLTTTQKRGLGRHLFAGWRYDEHDRPRPDFALNHPRAAGCQILLAGRNFGCGSSREHAPWALIDWGFRVVIALSFADIFRSNALKNGLLPVALSPAVHSALRAHLVKYPDAKIDIDVGERTMTVAGGPTARFELDAFSRRCLLEGLDELGYLWRFEADILEHERRHPHGPRVSAPRPAAKSEVSR